MMRSTIPDTAGLGALFEAIRARILAASDQGRVGPWFDTAIGRLRVEPAIADPDPARRQVVDDWLDAALAICPRPPDPLGELGPAVDRARNQLHWVRSYDSLESSPTLDAFREHYAWSRLAPGLIGIDGLLLGLTLQAPGVDYPAHRHDPAELYGIIAGGCDWQVGDGAYEPKVAGDLIVHGPGEPHAMLTHDQPMLCWVLWADEPDAAVSFVTPPARWPQPNRKDTE